METRFARENRIRVSNLLARADAPDAFTAEEKEAVDGDSVATSDIVVMPANTHVLEPFNDEKTDDVEKRVGAGQVVEAGYEHLRLVNGHDKSPLARLPVFALFHRQNATAGVPASFAAFMCATDEPGPR